MSKVETKITLKEAQKLGNELVKELTPHMEKSMIAGSIRRECINHVIVLSENHLLKILSSYFKYYNQDRTHCGLDKDAPSEHPIESKPFKGSKIIRLSRVGGLHNRYQWKEAA